MTVTADAAAVSPTLTPNATIGHARISAQCYATASREDLFAARSSRGGGPGSSWFGLSLSTDLLVKLSCIR
jgi:hypothetical protein